MAASRFAMLCILSLHLLVTWKGRQPHPNPASTEKVSSSQCTVHRSAPPLFADRPWVVLSISDAISELSHSAAPILRATSRPSRLTSKVVGTPGMARPRSSARRIDVNREPLDADLLIEALDRGDALAVDRQGHNEEVFAPKLRL